MKLNTTLIFEAYHIYPEGKGMTSGQVLGMIEWLDSLEDMAWRVLHQMKLGIL